MMMESGTIVKNDPKVLRAWCMYDWANSVYSLNITSSIFPAYYQAVTKTADSDKVDFLGVSIANSVLYTYALSFAFLCVVLISPLCGGIADHFGKKKFFMKIFCALGSFACMGLFFFTGENVEWGIAMLILATIGYAGSLVFYNAFLPIITTPDMTDKVSARGFSYGYIGSVILLLINIAMLMKPEFFGGISSGTASRISFLMVGVWWLGFAQYSFWLLPKDSNEIKESDEHFIKSGFQEIRKVWAQLSSMRRMKLFLISFLLYSMGMQTVMYVATLFGEKEFHLDTGQLISVVLVLQLVAIVGASIAAYLSKRIGNIPALIVIVFIWIGICIGAYFMENGQHFYMLASVVGLVMGGVQALSRSTYAKLIPQETKDHASYFSFYDIVEKMAIVLGTFSYGFIEQSTGSMRNSVLALGVFFVLGLVLLFTARRSQQISKMG